MEFLYGNTAQCGKSRFRENLSSDDGTFLKMYFVYLKKKWRNQGSNFPEDAAGVLCGVALYKKKEKLAQMRPLRYNVSVCK